ncbi:MAG: phosphoenolpyruvate--protein phosphotransferase [Spirochaetaceae bacterium]
MAAAYDEIVMQKLSGIPASPGIAVGRVHVHMEDQPPVPRYSVENDEIKGEIERFRQAVIRAREELIRLRDRAETVQAGSNGDFLDSHLLMLSDDDFLSRVESGVEDRQRNAEWVLHEETQTVVRKLASLDDQYLRERSVDIHDVGRRILNHLMYRERISLSDLTREVVLVTHDLLPSDAIDMNKRMIRGIAMDAGGKTSHTAILARAFEIPAVLGLGDFSSRVKNGSHIIVDGSRGLVVLEPDEETLRDYREQLSAYRKREVQLMSLNDLPAETRDGKLIHLKANIEIPEEVEAGFSHGADGVGLFRSEFLFLHAGRVPDEDSQYLAYRQVLEAMNSLPVTIRTLDVGGDKVIASLVNYPEKNPILGWRAIRFCLSRTEIFRTQLRALLRASIHGKLRIMFPMISGIEELNIALEFLDTVKREMKTAGEAFSDDIPVGIMIEVPSAAITSDILARRVDFFSIGTNDLIQYTIAVDRGNERTTYLYEPFHPGILRLLTMTIDNAHNAGIPVGMCGEMAGDPLATMLLMGMGLDEFSMGAVSIPEVKRIIRSVTMGEAEELVGTVMEMRSYVDIDSYIKRLMQERFDVRVY